MIVYRGEDELVLDTASTRLVWTELTAIAITIR